ncbi:MAG: hypothetical protein WAK00_03330 [Microbacterium sp.]|uniref:hypothetical protein n=1 Tax=Microbacterium sp. TaxID=51671 RepID=UPI003BB0D6EB
MTAPLEFPSDSADWSAFVGARNDARLERVDALAAELRDGSARTSMQTLGLWNDLQIELNGVRNEAHLFGEVHPDRAVRASAEQRVSDADAMSASLMSDAELAAVFAATSIEGLDPAAQRVHEQLLRDLRRGGAHLDEVTRVRVQELAARDSELGLVFARNIREGRREIRVAPEALDGLPSDFVAQHPSGDDGLVALSTDATDYMPVQYYARDRETRLTVRRRCSGGPFVFRLRERSRWSSRRHGAAV